MSERTGLRWRPAAMIVAMGALAFVVIYGLDRIFPDIWPHDQFRVLVLMLLGMGVLIALAGWWLFFSRLSWRARGLGLGVALAVLASPLALYQWKNTKGGFIPILEPRFWGKRQSFHIVNPLADAEKARPDFPQFLGPNRDGRLPGPILDPDWAKHPPEVVWRKDIGPACSGFAVMGNRAVTQEQRDGQEWVVGCDLLTGQELWRTGNEGYYENRLAGEGPRATPAIADGHVFTLGSTGLLRCLQLADGKPVWTRDLRTEAAVSMPDWGFASSPLVLDGKVIVSAGGANQRSLLAFHVADGQLAWSAGTRGLAYSSPILRTLAGRPQILMINSDALTAHDPATGTVLWEYPRATGVPNVAIPVVVGTNRVLVSTGYAKGSELLEVTPDAEGKMSAVRVWNQRTFQAKFSNPMERDGYLYGVSDGYFTCIDLQTGARKWRSAAYGHGQALFVGEYFLQGIEDPGGLVLLRPTPEAPNELAKLPVFDAKTWNPLTLCGDLLLMRNDREAICLRLPVKASNAAGNL